MITPMWAIQKCAVNDQDGKELIEVFNKLQIPFTIINQPPFTYDKIQDVPYDGKVIPYGGTIFINSIMKSLPTSKTNWHLEFNDNFKYSTAIKHLGEHMFNHDGTFMKLSEFNPHDHKWSPEEHLFIRPDSDLKEFQGGVISQQEMMQYIKGFPMSKWTECLLGSGSGANPDTMILIAEASKIATEWRTFIVNGKPITGSEYRVNHKLSISPIVPQQVYDYVQEVIKIWKPSNFFVVDVCDVGGDLSVLSVLEIGDLHSAGFYCSDKETIIKEVTNYVASLP